MLGCVIDTARGWQSHEWVLSSKRQETCPACELQARVPRDKQRWSSSWKPICQWICHWWSFIVHKGTRRSEAATTEEWIHVSHERMIIPDSFVCLLLLVSVPISLSSCVDAKQFSNRTLAWVWQALFLVAALLFQLLSYIFIGTLCPDGPEDPSAS